MAKGQGVRVMKSTKMIRDRMLKQNNKFSFEHDLEEHGSIDLAEFASALIKDRKSSDIEDNHWVMQLREKYINNPAERYAIAACMLYRAIDCLCYECGCDEMDSLKQG